MPFTRQGFRTWTFFLNDQYEVRINENFPRHCGGCIEGIIDYESERIHLSDITPSQAALREHLERTNNHPAIGD